MEKKPTNTTHVQSVERAISILELLADEGREMPLTEIAKTLGWPKSTVHGLIATLRDSHYIDQSPSNGNYRLGVRLFELGNAVARSWNIRSIALPIMQRMNRALGEMVHLAMEDSGEVLYIEKLDSTHMMRIVSEIGARLPMHCSGLGKVLLAYKTKNEVKWIVTKKGLRRMTLRTITDPQVLERELERVRQQGYAVDDREIMDSLRCVAAPIFDKNGSVRYAISVSALESNLRDARFEKIKGMVVEAAEQISYEMGYRPENVHTGEHRE